MATVFFYHAPLEPHADLLITPLHTTAPWYFLWLQGMLKIGDKVLWGVIIPTNIIPGILFVLPYFEVGPSRRYGDRRVGLTVILLSVAAMAVLSYMGTPHYAVSSSPDQEVVAALVPQTKPGLLRESNWDELNHPGTYEAALWNTAPSPTLKELLKIYNEEMIRAADNAKCRAAKNCLKDGHGYLIVENWQADLLRIRFRVIWEGGPKGGDVCQLGAKNEFCQNIYLHHYSDYGQGE